MFGEPTGKSRLILTGVDTTTSLNLNQVRTYEPTNLGLVDSYTGLSTPFSAPTGKRSTFSRSSLP